MSKLDIYQTTQAQVLAVLEGENDTIAKMATVSCLLRDAFPDRFFWTGFYIVDDEKKNELIVGPYQGTLGCLRIAFGRGVCGVAAAERETQVVEDVHAVKNHIACDSRSNSEIVVPVVNKDDDLIAVLDIDSTEFGAFDSIDKECLEELMNKVFG
ncbi:MAG: GAF domain-containing protein [Kordiimonas sp.]